MLSLEYLNKYLQAECPVASDRLHAFDGAAARFNHVPQPCPAAPAAWGPAPRVFNDPELHACIFLD